MAAVEQVCHRCGARVDQTRVVACPISLLVEEWCVPCHTEHWLPCEASLNATAAAMETRSLAYNRPNIQDVQEEDHSLTRNDGGDSSPVRVICMDGFRLDLTEREAIRAGIANIQDLHDEDHSAPRASDPKP